MLYPQAMTRLIHELSKLPGVGPKTAQRLAFHLLTLSDDTVAGLAKSMLEAKSKIGFCEICGQLTETSPCAVCSDEKRQNIICVVEEAKDVIAMERTKVFHGHYHVLGGAVSPLEGITPDDLRIRELLQRLNEHVYDEVVVATDPNVEGEATALYLAKLLKPLGIKMTRLARGLPIGGDLEYADEITLGRAMEGRVEF